MSAALVRKSLALVDDSSDIIGKRRKDKEVLDLIPQNHKVTRKIKKQGRKGEKVTLLQTQRKLTVLEAKKTRKSSEQILENNLKKLALIREACTIDLDEQITSQIIERAVTRRPVRAKKQQKAPEKTAFTEEDFKKFEEEYFDEDL